MKERPTPGSVVCAKHLLLNSRVKMYASAILYIHAWLCERHKVVCVCMCVCVCVCMWPSYSKRHVYIYAFGLGKWFSWVHKASSVEFSICKSSIGCNWHVLMLLTQKHKNRLDVERMSVVYHLLTLSVWRLKYPTWSQVAMNRNVGVKLPWLIKAICICSVALVRSCGSLVSLYHTSPVPVVSTSAQYGAISSRSPRSGNGSGVNCDTEVVKEIAPLLFT